MPQRDSSKDTVTHKAPPGFYEDTHNERTSVEYMQALRTSERDADDSMHMAYNHSIIECSFFWLFSPRFEIAILQLYSATTSKRANSDRRRSSNNNAPPLQHPLLVQLFVFNIFQM